MNHLLIFIKMLCDSYFKGIDVFEVHANGLLNIIKFIPNGFI